MPTARWHSLTNIASPRWWTVGLAGLAWLATSPRAMAADCEPLARGLTSEQTAKFSLAYEECPRLQASLSVALEASAAREAQQLRLFDASPKSPAVTTIAETPLRPFLASQAVPAAQPAKASAMRTGASALRALQLAPDIDAVARRYDIDPLLLHAIAYVESRHNAAAVSPAGALGLMQVMPATGRRFGIDAAPELHDARTNLDVSASYLKLLQQRFGNDLTLVLAAYNAGEGAVERYGRTVPPFAETRGYVSDVLSRYRALTAVARRMAGAARSAL